MKATRVFLLIGCLSAGEAAAPQLPVVTDAFQMSFDPGKFEGVGLAAVTDAFAGMHNVRIEWDAQP